MDFVKLSELIDSHFTIQSVGNYSWKMWDKDNNRMLTSESFIKGYQKKYPVQTDRGLLELGPGQLGNLLEGVLYQGKSDLIGKTFQVKSNGAQIGTKEIRYYLNPVKTGAAMSLQAPETPVEQRNSSRPSSEPNRTKNPTEGVSEPHRPYTHVKNESSDDLSSLPF